jgi:hypothetical protein
MQTFEPPQTERAKILITVKTYPLLSSKHTETVCTAGFREEGKWVRIYPVPFRIMDKDKQFKKYQWIEADIVRDLRDPRPESYRLTGDIKPLHCLDTQKAWEERKKLVLSKVYYNLDTLIHEARDTKQSTSLATFKPAKIVNFRIERDSSLHDRKQKLNALKKQLSKAQAERLVQAVPFKFYYTFIDQLGKRSTLQILDWEIYQLCRKLIRKHGARKAKISSILREKYLTQLTKNRDVYLFLGTNKHWHIRRSNNPFMIVGIFYPPAIRRKI